MRSGLLRIQSKAYRVLVPTNEQAVWKPFRFGKPELFPNGSISSQDVDMKNAVCRLVYRYLYLAEVTFKQRITRIIAPPIGYILKGQLKRDGFRDQGHSQPLGGIYYPAVT